MLREPKTEPKTLDLAQADFIAAIDNFRAGVLDPKGIHFRYALSFRSDERALKNYEVEIDYDLDNEANVNAIGDVMRDAMDYVKDKELTNSFDMARQNIANKLHDSMGVGEKQHAAGVALRLLDVAQKFDDKDFLNAYAECVHASRWDVFIPAY